MVTEIVTSFDYFRSQHEGEEVRRVVVSGGASLPPELVEQLHAALELPVGRGRRLRTVDATHRQSEPIHSNDEGPFLAGSVGLALGPLR